MHPVNRDTCIYGHRPPPACNMHGTYTERNQATNNLRHQSGNTLLSALPPSTGAFYIANGTAMCHRLRHKTFFGFAWPSRVVKYRAPYVTYYIIKQEPTISRLFRQTRLQPNEKHGGGKSRVHFAAVYFSGNPRQKKCWIEANTARAMFQTCNVGTCAGYSTVTTLPVPDQTTAHTMSRTNCILR